MNKFYLLRHANTDRSKILPPSEYPLTCLGHEQAKKLVQVLNKLNIEQVFCSPYLRAKSTIDPFLKDSGLNATYIEGLKGRQIGNTPKDEVWDFFKKSFEDFKFKQFGSESAGDCQSRIVKVIESVNPSNAIFVSHSNPISLFLNTLDSTIDFKWFKSMTTPMLIEVDNNKYKIIDMEL